MQKLVIPAALSAAAGAAAFVLSNKKDAQKAVPKLREAVSDLPVPNVREGAADLAGDLRGKLDDVLGKDRSGDLEQTVTSTPQEINPDFAQRRRERQQRRESRRGSRS